MGKDNRGYTLIELVISMAVFVLVAGAILLFIYSGSRSYSFAKTEVDLQIEAQTLLGQMNTMILEADSAVFDDSDADKPVLTLYQVDTKNNKSATSGAVTVEKTAVRKKVIYLDKTNEINGAYNLYLEQYDDDSIPALSGGQDALFANYVESFEVDIQDSQVTVNLGMKNHKRSFQADITTKMRNGLVTYL